MTYPNIISALTGVLLAVTATLTHAAFSISGTRVIYEEAKGETNVRIRYSVGDTPVIMQAWLDDGGPQAQPGTQNAPFILSPAVAHMRPGAEQVVRVLRIDSLPTDRESLFFFNVLEIPPDALEDLDQTRNTIQFSTQARLKFFYRPLGLQPAAEKALDLLRFALQTPQDDGTLPVRVTALLLGLGVSDAALAQSPGTQNQQAVQVAIAALRDIATQSGGNTEAAQAAIAAIARIAATGQMPDSAPALPVQTTHPKPSLRVTFTDIPPESPAAPATPVTQAGSPVSPAVDVVQAASTAARDTASVAPAADRSRYPGVPSLATATSATSASGRYTFNANRLAFPVDLSMYADGNPVIPGVYKLDVHLNASWIGKYEIRFAHVHPTDRIAQPCFDRELTDLLGLDEEQFDPDMLARLQAGESLCGALSAIAPGANAVFETGEQKLVVNASQEALLRLPRGYVNPKRWDYGINAATLFYNYNAYSNQYLERAAPELRSRFVVGDTTSGHVFNSLALRGAQLVTDTSMRPDSQNGFVPVIRGIAQTNAKVTVSQRDQQIFEMTVPPGPFVIDDLYPNGRGGDLLVTITEADGSARSFSVAYANLPKMQRPGSLYYSAAVGRYRDRNMFEDEPVLGMLTGSYGLNNTITAYGGALAAQGYHAFSVGAGFNLPMGAVSADVTWANARGLGEATRGYALRLGYTKLLPQLNSDITLAMYRYATQGYYEPAQAFQLRDARARTGGGSRWAQSTLRRHQLALRLTHNPGGDWGALNLGASLQDYWNRDGRDLQYYLGYGRSVGIVSLGLNINRSRNIAADRWENQYMLTMALPLGMDSGHPTYLNSSYAWRDDSHNAQATLSGNAGERNQIGYSLFASGNKIKGNGTESSGGGSVSFTTPVARVAASASASSGNSRQLSMSASGGVLAFENGVILSPDLGETVGVVQAKDAAGASLQNHPAVILNARGHALVPYLQPYRENDVLIDPRGLSKDVELNTTSQKIAPTEGAVVLLNYDTRHGYAMLLRGQRQDGSMLPFGAAVLLVGVPFVVTASWNCALNVQTLNGTSTSPPASGTKTLDLRVMMEPIMTGGALPPTPLSYSTRSLEISGLPCSASVPGSGSATATCSFTFPVSYGSYHGSFTLKTALQVQLRRYTSDNPTTQAFTFPVARFKPQGSPGAGINNLTFSAANAYPTAYIIFSNYTPGDGGGGGGGGTPPPTPTCIISPSQPTVQLGTVGLNQIPNIGDATTARAFSMQFNNCKGHNQVLYRFQPYPYAWLPTAGGLLPMTTSAPGGSMATGVGGQILEGSSGTVPLSFSPDTFTHQLPGYNPNCTSNCNYSVPLRARMIRHADPATPGLVYAQMQMVVQYN